MQGKTLLHLQVAEGRLEDTPKLNMFYGQENYLSQVGRNHKYVQGYSPLNLTWSADEGTSFKVGIQEVDIMDDTIWQLKVSRMDIDTSDTRPAASMAYSTIWQEITAPLSQLDFVPSDNSWIQCKLGSAVGRNLY